MDLSIFGMMLISQNRCYIYPSSDIQTTNGEEYLLHWWKEEMVIFNNTLHTFYLCKSMRDLGRDHSYEKWKPLLPFHGLLFQIGNMGFFLHASSHIKGSTYYILAEKRNSSVGPPEGIDLMTPCTMSWCSTTQLHLIPCPIKQTFLSLLLDKHILRNKL